jgi:DnaJ-class molecular chaperone
VCGGKRTVMEKKEYDVSIKKGMTNGEQILFEKQGE